MHHKHHQKHNTHTQKKTSLRIKWRKIIGETYFFLLLEMQTVEEEKPKKWINFILHKLCFQVEQLRILKHESWTFSHPIFNPVLYNYIGQLIKCELERCFLIIFTFEKWELLNNMKFCENTLVHILILYD